MTAAAPAQGKRVLFVQRRLPHYRVPFFQQLAALLAIQGHSLVVAHGTPTQAESSKRDEGELPGALHLPTRYALGARVCWQPFASGGFDLVIVTQENRLLFNHWLARPFRGFRLAFMGHGGNSAASPGSLRERFKRFTTGRADWWFAYTQVSAERLASAGFPAGRVTVFNNSVDTRALQQQAVCLTSADVAAHCQKLGISGAHPIGLFMGSLYAEKRLDLLVDAACQVRASLPGFTLVIAGDGPDRAALLARTAALPWIVHAGAVRGQDKALLLKMADLLLMPGAVGLSVLDGFAVGLPIATTTLPGHGPEVAYLRPGHNGLLTAPNAAAYAAEVSGLLASPARLASFKAAALQSAKDLSIENMAQRFAGGIEQALSAPRK